MIARLDGEVYLGLVNAEMRAAPDLLAACEQAETVLDAIEKACKANGDADAPGVTFCGLYDAHTDLCNAIAAARGEVVTRA